MKSVASKFVLRPAFLIALLVATTGPAAWLTLSTSARRHAEGRWVDHTLEVLTRIEETRAQQGDVRNREHNLVFGVGDGEDRRYAEAVQDSKRDIERLRLLTFDNPVQQRAIEGLQRAWYGFVRESEGIVAGRPDAVGRSLSPHHAAPFLVATSTLKSMRMEEERLLILRETRLRRTGEIGDWSILGVVAMMTLSLLALAAMSRHAEETAAQQHAILERDARRLQNLAERLPVATVHLVDGQVTLNHAAETLLGYADDEIETLDDWFRLTRNGHIEEAAEAKAAFAQRWREGGSEPLLRRYVRKDGEVRTVQLAGYEGEGGEVWILRDVTDEREAKARLEDANRRLETLAATDGLTGLTNQRAFRDRLAEECAEARRLGRPLSLLLLDVDHFKGYNDAFGHPAGDSALRAVAEVLRTRARLYDVAARPGGEEFALLLPATDVEEALRVAERAREDVEGRAWPLRQVTVSVGVAGLAPMDTPESFVEAADRALYAAKAAGRNRVVRAEEAKLPDESPGGDFARPAIPENEAARLAAVEESELLSPWTDPEFDALAEAASRALGTPVGLMSIVGERRQRFKARIGLNLRETSREASFCAHTMLEDRPLVVNDTFEDPRFGENPLVLGGPEIRFYAGATIRDANGLPLGALCAVDSVPHEPTEAQIETLARLAREASRLVGKA